MSAVLVPPPAGLDPDTALDTFLSWVQARGLQLWPHQEEAILEIFAGRHTVLDAPTGSGKSLVALALHWKTLCEGGRTVYTAPVKALVNEKFLDLCRTFGPEQVGLVTGDGAVNRDAPVLCCTAEILARMALMRSEQRRADSAVLDEFHYYGDRDRGGAWQIPLLRLPSCQFLLLSGTLGDTTAIRDDLSKRSGRETALVRGGVRPVPLTFSYSTKPLLEQLTDLVRGGRSPVYAVHFTQNAATERAQDLMSTDWCDKDEKRALAEALNGVRFTSPFGATLARYLRHGIGVHHAGLLPRYRLCVERLAQAGQLKVICGTDTLGVGINVPIKTVLLTQLCKFDGERVELLDARSFQQISGRAGRAGFDKEGYVVVQAPEHHIENLRAEQKAQGDPKKLKRIVRAQPPQRGYKHWDEQIFRTLVDRAPETLKARLQIDHGLLMTLLQDAAARTGDARGGFEDLLALIDESHSTHGEKAALRTRAQDLLDSLKKAGVVFEEGWTLQIRSGLQLRFNLHHNLSLLLVDALETLDPEAPTHAADVLAWVEAILDNPLAILLKQQEQARTQVLAALKAEGVPFEERQEMLDAVSWPKPHAEAIYTFFDQWREHHPWLEGDNVRPKGVVRAMMESYETFHGFVRDMGLQRQEGVLLRYLTDAYKALVENVPADRQTDALLELSAWLRSTIAVVDGSLLAEWERLVHGREVAEEQPEEPDLSRDRRSFYARLRAEGFQVLAALSRGAWDDAAALLAADEDGALSDPERISRDVLSVAGGSRGLRFDHEARKAENVRITATAPWCWELRIEVSEVPEPQADIEAAWVDEEDDGEVGHDGNRWALLLCCDLRPDKNPEGPLLRWVSFG